MNEFYVSASSGPFSLSLDDNDRVVAAVWHPNSSQACVYVDPGPYESGAKVREFMFVTATGTPYSTSGFKTKYICSLVRPQVPSLRTSYTAVMAPPGAGVSEHQVLDNVEIQPATWHEVWHLYQIDVGRYETDHKTTDPKDWTQAEALAELAAIVQSGLSWNTEYRARFDRVNAAIRAHTD